MFLLWKGGLILPDIIKVNIKSSFGFVPLEDAYNDKLSIASNTISYEYVPAYITELNQTQKWSYKTNNPNFILSFNKITKMIGDIIHAEVIEHWCDIGEIEFIVTYEDNPKKKVSFLLPPDYFENALEWTERLNKKRACSREIVEREIIFT